MLAEHLTPDVVRRRGLFNPAEVSRLLDTHVAGRRDHGRELWALLALELWCRRFLGS
jgi:asparagine synthase (glutamine-hydrolysing)